MGLKELEGFDNVHWHGVRSNSQSQYCPYYLHLWGIHDNAVKVVGVSIDNRPFTTKLLTWDGEYYSFTYEWGSFTAVGKDLTWFFLGQRENVSDKRKRSRGQVLICSNPVVF